LPVLVIAVLSSFVGIQIDQKLAGDKIDPTFVINTLDFYIKFYKGTKMDKSMVISVKLSS